MEVAGGFASFLSAAIATTQYVEKTMRVDRRLAQKDSKFIVSPKSTPGESSRAHDQKPRRMPYPLELPDSKMNPKSIKSWWDTLQKAPTSKDDYPADTDLPPTPPNTINLRAPSSSPSLNAIIAPDSVIPQQKGSENAPVVGILKTSKPPNLKRIVNRFIGKPGSKGYYQGSDSLAGATYSPSVTASPSPESILDGTESYLSPESNPPDLCNSGLSPSDDITMGDPFHDAEGEILEDLYKNKGKSAWDDEAYDQETFLSPERLAGDTHSRNEETPDLEWVDAESSTTLSSSPNERNHQYSPARSLDMNEEVHDRESSVAITNVAAQEGSPSEQSSPEISNIQDTEDLRKSSETNHNQDKSSPASSSGAGDESPPPEQYSQTGRDTSAAPLRNNRALIQQKIDTISAAAYERLQAAAPSQSIGYQRFVKKIPNHNFLFDRGFTTFKLFLTPEHDDTLSSMSLLDIYSMLHFAYSISMAESSHPTDCTPAEFRCGIGTFRNILNNNNPRERRASEVKIFDEIVTVMWSEIKYGIAWIGKKTGWNWHYMFNMSTKMRDIEIARQLLKRAAENNEDLSIAPEPDSTFTNDPKVVPTDPSPGRRPSFVGEITVWEEDSGESLVEVRLEQHEQLASPLERQRRPPDKSTWWEVVTGTTFLMIVASLQEIQAAHPTLMYFPTNVAYSCLGYPDPTNDSSISPHYRNYSTLINKQVFAPTIDFYIRNLNLSSQSKAIVKLVLELVKRNVIHTLRHFEDYVIGMSKLFQWTREQRTDFLTTLLNFCWSFSREIFTCMMPYKIKSEPEAAYSIEYITWRIKEEGDEGYSSPQASSHVDSYNVENDMDAMDVDSNEQPDTSSQTAKDVAKEGRSMPDKPLNRSSTSNGSRKRAPSRSISAEKRRPEPCSPKEPRQLFCTVPECSFKKPFSSQSNLNRHNRAYHSSSRQEGFPCPECGEKFARRDNVGKHRDMVHGIPRGTKKRRRV